MAITALPTPPSRSNPTTFAALADTFLSALPTFGTEANALATQLNGIGIGTYSATSTTSLTIGTGSKSLTIETNKSFSIGQPVLIASTSTPSTYMTGQVTSYNTSTGALVVNVTNTAGSGTIALWTISLSAVFTASSKIKKYQVFTTSGTWVQPADVSADDIVEVLIISAGGGGASGSLCLNVSTVTDYASGAGAGGGGGSGFGIVSRLLLGTTSGTSYTVTIGAGGSGGAALTTNGTFGNNGGNGGTTSFGTRLSCTGGNGGTSTAGTTNTYLGSASSNYSGNGGAGGTLATLPGSIAVPMSYPSLLTLSTIWPSFAASTLYRSEGGNSGYAVGGAQPLAYRALGSISGGGGDYEYMTYTGGVTRTNYAIAPVAVTSVYNWIGTTFYGVTLSRTGGAAGLPSWQIGSSSYRLNATPINGTAGTGYGSGGGGGSGTCTTAASGSSGAGGAGSPGVVVVVWESAL